MFEVNALTLFENICELFQTDKIPLENLVSDLGDSTNYMHGKKGSLEKWVRDEGPYLLHIDGDCHHQVHNWDCCH